MVNPRTTVVGALLVLSALTRIALALVSGGNPPQDVWNDLLIGLAGLGLIAASDGKP